MHTLNEEEPFMKVVLHTILEFTVVPLPILGDNYCYVVVDDASKTAVAIDAADPEAVKVSCELFWFLCVSVCVYTVQSYVREKNLILTALLTTHRHWYYNITLLH